MEWLKNDGLVAITKISDGTFVFQIWNRAIRLILSDPHRAMRLACPRVRPGVRRRNRRLPILVLLRPIRSLHRRTMTCSQAPRGLSVSWFAHLTPRVWRPALRRRDSLKMAADLDSHSDEVAQTPFCLSNNKPIRTLLSLRNHCLQYRLINPAIILIVPYNGVLSSTIRLV